MEPVPLKYGELATKYRLTYGCFNSAAGDAYITMLIVCVPIALDTTGACVHGT